MKQKNRLSLLLLLIILISNCGKPVKIEDLPGITGGSPLSGVKSFSFIIEDFEDLRLDKKEGIFQRKMYANEDPVLYIRNKMAAEFSRSGHILLDPDSSQHDFIIGGSILEYKYDIGGDFFTSAYRGIVEAEIIVKDGKGEDIKLQKMFRGFYEKRGIASPVWKVNMYLNEAINNMIRQFTSDPEVIDAFKSKSIK